MAFSRTQMCPARDASDWDADVVKVGRTVLTDTFKRRNCYFKLFAVALGANEARRDVFVSANTNDQTGSSVQNHLKSTDDL